MARGSVHKGVEFEVREIEPGRWLWIIQAADRPIIGEARYRSRGAAVEACIEAINSRVYR